MLSFYFGFSTVEIEIVSERKIVGDVFHQKWVNKNRNDLVNWYYSESKKFQNITGIAFYHIPAEEYMGYYYVILFIRH